MESLIIAFTLIISIHPTQSDSCLLHYGLQAPLPMGVALYLGGEVRERGVDMTVCPSEEEEQEVLITPSSLLFSLIHILTQLRLRVCWCLYPISNSSWGL